MWKLLGFFLVLAVIGEFEVVPVVTAQKIVYFSDDTDHELRKGTMYYLSRVHVML